MIKLVVGLLIVVLIVFLIKKLKDWKGPLE
jgi:hypothetical protein